LRVILVRGTDDGGAKRKSSKKGAEGYLKKKKDKNMRASSEGSFEEGGDGQKWGSLEAVIIKREKTPKKYWRQSIDDEGP